MQWIYLILFACAVLVPELIRRDFSRIQEERIETVLIFFFGVIGFLIYFAKEKSLIRHLSDKLRLQQERQDMTRDLSDSYSYIGEVNRKMDLMMSLVLDLPEAAMLFRKGEKKNVYRSLASAILLFSKSDTFSLRIVDREERRMEKEIREGGNEECFAVPMDTLLASDQVFREEGGCVIARSPKSIGPYSAYLIFPKTVNRHEDREMFEAFATEGLLLYFLEKEHFSPEGRRKGHISDKAS